jgi:hypothetical protein
MPDPGSNRKIYLTKDLELNNAATFLDDGATLFFRVRLATDGVLDQIHPDDGGDLVDVPATGDGYLLHNEAKANINLDQADNGLIGFSLATADENPEGVAGLVMNALNGTAPSSDVDAGEGTANMIELDPTVWHDFWVTIQADASGVGTHQVDISVDGGPAQTFIVTAGSAGTRHDGTAVLAMGVGATPLSGAIDIAALQFAPGVIPAPVLMPEPIAHWPMDEGAGEVVADVVGGNDGTIVGGISWLTEGGVAFDNIDGSHIEVPHADVLDFGDVDFSISMLIRYPAAQVDFGEADRWIIKGTHGDPGTGSRYEIFHTSGPEIRFSIDNGPDDVKSKLAVSNEAIVTGEWVHVVAVRDAANDLMSLYADGVLLGTQTDTSGDISSGEVMFIGESTDEADTAMSGDMADIRIYDAALTEDQIAAIY